MPSSMSKLLELKSATLTSTLEIFSPPSSKLPKLAVQESAEPRPEP